MAPTEPAWILPRANTSTLCCLAQRSYRDAGKRLVDVCVVPMPLCAVHVLDCAADLLVYAEAGGLVAVRGLGRDEPTASRVALPAGLEVRALAARGDVVYVGGRCSRDAGGLFGLVDLQGEARLRPMPMELARDVSYQGVECLVLRHDRLLAVGDVPKHVYNVADPRNPQIAETHVKRFLPPLPRSVGCGARFVAALFGEPRAGTEVMVFDIVSQQQYGSIYSAQTLDLGDVRSVALTGDLMLLAAGAAGVGLLPIQPSHLWPPRPPRVVLDRTGKPIPPAFARSARNLDEVLRLLPVAAGAVVDVMPVDETHAIAIVHDGCRLDAALVRTG